ncbi:olfactory receptor 1J4-like [Phacochoerus africanus]|uniref:olfactory receptor 1J4-like n=1 Tax=Phacochoerus africanus TaxID=41426 RepID=UPI001FD93074|nr:olfactory receptor 1J4-like [Phacochoerus africanus]
MVFDCFHNFLLKILFCDRYVTICQPLYYSTIMKQELHVSLVAVSWFLCCIHALLHTLLLVHLFFSMDSITFQFFCNLTDLLKLRCSETSLGELSIFPVRGTLFILPLSSILGLYIHIGTTVMKVSSSKSLFKVFSTCGSHIFMLSLYYGTLATIYFFFSSWDSYDNVIITSVMYAVVTPMLNPFISSLRKIDRKQALEIFVNRANFMKYNH